MMLILYLKVVNGNNPYDGFQEVHYNSAYVYLVLSKSVVQ